MNELAKTHQLEAEIFLCGKTNLKNGIFSFITCLVISLCCSLGAVFSFITSYDTGANIAVIAIVTTICCAVFAAVSCFCRKYSYPAVFVLSALYLVVTILFKNNICNGMASIVNTYSSASFPDRYGGIDRIYILSPQTETADVTLVVTMFALILGGLCSCRTLMGTEFSLVFSAVTLGFAMAYGFAPNYVSFIMLFAGWTGILAYTAGSVHETELYRRRSSQAGLTGVLGGIVIGTVTALSVNAFGAARPEFVVNAKDSIMSNFSSESITKSIKEIVEKKIVIKKPLAEHGALGNIGRITFTGSPVLRVTIPKSYHTVYLKGFVGSVYTGNSWEELPQNKLSELDDINESFRTPGLDTMFLSSHSFDIINPDVPQLSFSVTNISAREDCFYMPYDLVQASVSHYDVKSEMFAANGTKSWRGKFYDREQVYSYRMLLTKSWTPLTEETAADHAAYSEFVRETYLDVPTNFYSATDIVFDDDYYEFISHEVTNEGKSTLTDDIVFARKIYYIKEWLRDNCEYSLNAGKLPPGEDFAEYFITQTRKGSCTHFASAAALLCRYAGIPARYAEGYVIKPDDFTEELSYGSMDTVDVTDARGHAWVEIYIDGFGWYPMEFTSGYGNIQTAVTTAPITEEEENISDTETQPVVITPEPNNEEAGSDENIAETTVTKLNADMPEDEPVTTTAPLYTEPAQPSETQKNENIPNIGFSAFGRNDGEKVRTVIDLTVPIILLAAIIFAAAFIFARRMYIKKRRAHTIKLGGSEAVRAYYRQFMKLVKLTWDKDSKLPETYTGLAEMLESKNSIFGDGAAKKTIGIALKAEFGGGSLTDEDVREMKKTVGIIKKRFFASANTGKKLMAKYIFALA